VKNLQVLENNKLIVRSPEGKIKHTGIVKIYINVYFSTSKNIDILSKEYGGIMTRYYIKLDTMISIINSENPLSIKDTVC
jgi:hypothetical protein